MTHTISYSHFKQYQAMDMVHKQSRKYFVTTGTSDDLALVEVHVISDREWFTRTKLSPHVKRARENEITLKPTDFKRVDGEWTVDGMEPKDWLDAMLMP